MSSNKRTSWTPNEMMSVVNLAAERHCVYLTAYNHRQMIVTNGKCSYYNMKEPTNELP